MKVHIGKYPKDPKKERKVKIQIDPWDTWNMDSTLALIIVPMLKQLKKTKQGGPFVADEDVPEELRRSGSPDLKDWEADSNWFKRWDWVLNEMIFAFESTLTDWEDQFWEEYPEMDFTEYPEDEDQLTETIRWKKEGVCDWDGRKAYEDRMQRGYELFGKYYRNLWD